MSGTETQNWTATIPLTDLKRRKKARVELGDRAVALFMVGDQVFALDDTCIHNGRSLSRGALWQGKVICPGHQWKFDPETGEAEGRDDCQPVHDVRVIDGVVYVADRSRS